MRHFFNRPNLLRDLRTAAVAVFVSSLVMATPTIAATVKNADKVDGKHAVGANAGEDKRAGKLVATDKETGLLPDNIIATAPNADTLDGLDSTDLQDAETLDGRDSSVYMTHWMNVNANGTIRTRSAGLAGAAVTKLPDSGRYCVTLPDGIQGEAAVGSIQETMGGTNEYVIAVTTTFGNACNVVDGWDIAVLTRINGSAADGAFNLVIPGAPQG